MKYEHWKDYKERSGDDNPVYPGKWVVDDDEKGFVIFSVDGEYMVVHQMYGDGKYWEEVVKEQARKLGKKKMRWFTKRNPKTWIRKYNAKIIGYVMESEV